MLTLEDYWAWDSWIADDGQTYHLYFLHAPKRLGDPGKRHINATIGHATSPDLTNWTYHGTALAPGELGGWDDLALWTGSVVQGDDGLWRMFYTALSTGGHDIFDQRIGVAVSDDLHVWRRPSMAPVCVADLRWYKTLGIEGSPASETWRDPFVFRDPDGDGWHMLVTARLAGAPRFDDGVLAHARSADLLTWELGEPVSTTSGFGQIEVPQVRVIEGHPVLTFTCHPQEQADSRTADGSYYCTWTVPGTSVTGLWDLGRAEPFLDEPYLFAAPLVQDRTGQWVYVGFRNTEPQGVHAFDIIDPVPVALTDSGTLQARRSPA